MFEIGIEKLALLLILALIIFGPERLPQIARQAGQALHRLRRMASDATSDLKSGLGPEYADLDPADLDPRRFIRKYLLENDPYRQPPRVPEYRERPPYDSDAT